MKKYRTILMDPNWNEQGGGKCKRGADRHYKVTTLKDIYQTIRLCPMFAHEDDAHLYLWVTDNHLPDGLELMRLLDFRYIRTLPWIKFRDQNFIDMLSIGPSDTSLEKQLQIGIGQYFRGSSELLLFGVHGNGKAVCTDRKDISNVILARRTAHSRKPESSYQKIEARSKGPYLEMYARRMRQGWDVWGDEV